MNWEKILGLLRVVEKAAQHGPPLRHIQDAAMRELGGIKDERLDTLKQRAETAEAAHQAEARAHSETRDRLAEVEAALAKATAPETEPEPMPSSAPKMRVLGQPEPTAEERPE